MNKNKGFSFTCRDLFKSLDRTVILVLLIISAILVVALFYVLPVHDINNYGYLECLTDVMSGLLGFLITASAIMFALPDRVVCLLKAKADDGKKPYDVIIGSMLFTSCIAVLTIIITIVGMLLPEGCVLQFFIWISLCLALYVLLLCVHILLYLFAARTFINP